MLHLKLPFPRKLEFEKGSDGAQEAIQKAIDTQDVLSTCPNGILMPLAKQP